MAHDIRPVRLGHYVYLIDGSGYIFRAYHALPPLTRRSDGLPVGSEPLTPTLSPRSAGRGKAALLFA